MVLASVFVVQVLSLASTAAAGAPPPPLLHSVAGREDCLSCHGPTQSLPIPKDHAGYPNSACVGCHTPMPVASSGDSCLSCHGKPGLSWPLKDGNSLNLYIDPSTLAASVHGAKLLCTDCHSLISSYPHPPLEVASARQYSIAQYELCKRCHFANYTKTLDSMHFTARAKGNTQAPICTDCHGAHNVTNPAQPRTRISQTCSGCHQGVYDAYADSVHGKALIDEGNQDVPVCTTCHSAHSIVDPRTASFRADTPQLCAQCHSNEQLMKKYGISTAVLKTYLGDFHGVSVALAQKQNPDIWSYKAVCTDCHGVHDIAMVNDPNSSVLKANLVNVCRKCHSDASDNFSGAWLSHYEPSFEKAPLVFLVRLFYMGLIPFIIGGLLLHILLDLWRAATNR